MKDLVSSVSQTGERFFCPLAMMLTEQHIQRGRGEGLDSLGLNHVSFILVDQQRIGRGSNWTRGSALLDK